MIINKKERITNQKRVILDYLKSTEIHPTAEKVYFEVKKKLPQISLGTVYRILNNLKEKGEIQEIPSQVSHFDGNVLPHAHFICQNCQKIFDVFLRCEILKNQKIKVGKIKNYQIIFYGICKKCQK
jgi:Fur family ferric uptake transcriptional regulator/Fur family peroxide stress response transcriptional regulator